MLGFKSRTWRRNGHFHAIIFNISICDLCAVLLAIGTESWGKPMSKLTMIDNISRPPFHSITICFILTFFQTKLISAMEPGGYFEYQDYGCEVYLSDGTQPKGDNEQYPVATYFHHTIHAAEKQGRPLLIAPSMKERMEKIGFVDCEAQTTI